MHIMGESQQFIDDNPVEKSAQKIKKLNAASAKQALLVLFLAALV
jgi:hypothetical protein